MLTEKTHKRIIWTAFAVCVLTSNPSTAKETDEACQLALESVQALFQPNYDLAITRGTYQSNLPEKTIKYIREENNHDVIKHLGMNLESDLPSAQAVARSNLLYFLRFGKTVSVRKSAFVELSRSKDFKHLVDQVIAARVYEQDPAFRRWLDATVERVIPEHEAYRKANWTPMPREWLNETQLPAGDKERLWSVENGYSYRNPLEIHARVEQIPAEIEWLDKLRTLAPTSAAARTVYENAVNTVKARRMELADRLYDDEIFELYRQRKVDFLEWGTSSEKLNAEMFPTYYPPFTPNRPYVHVRVRPGQTLSLVRAYGGGALPGGAFFFPARSNYMKSSIEARDTGALPDKNTTEKWIKVTFGAGEDFYVGAINPQILTNGANIRDFGRGGLGGEIQYWRDGRGKSQWTMEQAGSEVPTIQNPKLQKAQQILREQVGTGEDQNWPRAEQIYKEARERAVGSDSTLISDLKKMEAELWRFHHVNYVRQLDNLLTYLRLPSFDRQYIETKAIDRFHDFSERDKKYNPLPSPNWIEMLKWQQLVRKEFTAKVDEYYSTGKIPEKIRVPPIPPKDIPQRPLTAEERQFLDEYLDNGHDW